MAVEKKEDDRGDLEVLRKLVFTKLNSIKHKSFDGKSVDDFSLAFRVFLLKYLRLNYEFTEEELLAELDKKHTSKELKERVMHIANVLAEVKYEGRQITKQEFQEILAEGFSLINFIVDKKEKKAEEKSAEEHGHFELLIQKIFRSKKAPEAAAKEKKAEAGRLGEGREYFKDFFHKIGLYLTPEEKKQIALRQEKERKEKLRSLEQIKKQQEFEKQLAEIERKKSEQELLRQSKIAEQEKAKEEQIKLNELERQRAEAEKLRKEQEKKRIAEEKMDLLEAGRLQKEEESKQIKWQKQKKSEEGGKKREESKLQKKLEKEKREKEELQKILLEDINKLGAYLIPEQERQKKLDRSKDYQTCKEALVKANNAFTQNDLANAKGFYTQARDIYLRLRYNEQKSIYHELLQLYNKLIKANKVYK